MVEYFVFIVCFLLGESIAGLAFVLMVSNNLIAPEYFGLSIFILVIMIIVKKLFGSVKNG